MKKKATTHVLFTGVLLLTGVLSYGQPDFPLGGKDSLLIMAENCRLAYDYLKAAACYRRYLVEKDSLNISVIESLGDIENSLGNYFEAVRLYKKLYSPDSSSLRISMKYASALQNLGKTRDAITILKKEDTLVFNNFHLSKKLGDLYFALSVTDTAIIYYKRADLQNSRSLLTKQILFNIYFSIQEDYNTASVYASMASKLDSTNSLYLKQQGLCDFKLEKYRQAAVKLSTVHKLGDSTLSLILPLGISYYMTDSSIKAISFLRQAIWKDSTNSVPVFYLGSALRKAGRHEEALQYLNKALELNKPDPNTMYLIHSEIGMSYLTKKMAGEAYSCFSSAAKYKPHEIKLLYYMGIAKSEARALSDLKKARELLESFVMKAGASGSAEYVILLAYAGVALEKINQEIFMLEGDL